MASPTLMASGMPWADVHGGPVAPELAAVLDVVVDQKGVVQHLQRRRHRQHVRLARPRAPGRWRCTGPGAAPCPPGTGGRRSGRRGSAAARGPAPPAQPRRHQLAQLLEPRGEVGAPVRHRWPFSARLGRAVSAVGCGARRSRGSSAAGAGLRGRAQRRAAPDPQRLVPGQPHPEALPVVGLATAAASVRLVQRPDPAGCRRASRVARQDAVDRPAGGLVGRLHGGQVGVRADVVGGQEQVGEPGDRLGPQAPGVDVVDQQRLEVGLEARAMSGSPSTMSGSRKDECRSSSRSTAWPPTFTLA